MGTVTKSIGTSARDYSTLQSWEDALPANLVTDGNAQVGQCYNDSEFTAGVTISGQTTNSTNSITLTCATGQSFADNASVQSNALKYNQANGVGVVADVTSGVAVVHVSTSNVTVSRLQIKNTQAVFSAIALKLDEGGSAKVGNQLVLEATSLSGGGLTDGILYVGAGHKCLNALVVQRATAAAAGNNAVTLYDAGSIFNVSVVCPSDVVSPPAQGVRSKYSGNVMVNCAVFGFVADYTGTALGTSTTNFTDDTTPSTGFTGSLTYGSQFQNTTNASGDWRAKAGGGILDAGTDTHVAQPLTATDIAGTSRPQGSAYDGGAWELVASGGATARTRLALLGVS